MGIRLGGNGLTKKLAENVLGVWKFQIVAIVGIVKTKRNSEDRISSSKNVLVGDVDQQLHRKIPTLQITISIPIMRHLVDLYWIELQL